LTVPSEIADKNIYMTSEPVGVGGLITPWNFPIAIPFWNLSAALVAGNTMVFKPSSESPLMGIEVVKALEEAGLPAGVVNLVFGRGSTIGRQIVEHPGIDLLSFTGSVETGRDIKQRSGKLDTRRPPLLELGGNNFNIIMPDANMDLALKNLLFGSFYTAGQRCTHTQRAILVEGVSNDFIEKLKEGAEAMKTGNGLMLGTDVGPLINKRALENVDKAVQDLIAKGARLVTGGYRLTGGDYDKGNYYANTIFIDETPNQSLGNEEIFGPVLIIKRAKNLDKAIEIGNASGYGLSAAIHTNDHRTARIAVKRFKAGLRYINCSTSGAEIGGPFGGQPNSLTNLGMSDSEAGPFGIDYWTDISPVIEFYGKDLVLAQGVKFGAEVVETKEIFEIIEKDKIDIPKKMVSALSQNLEVLIPYFGSISKVVDRITRTDYVRNEKEIRSAFEKSEFTALLKIDDLGKQLRITELAEMRPEETRAVDKAWVQAALTRYEDTGEFEFTAYSPLLGLILNKKKLERLLSLYPRSDGITEKILAMDSRELLQRLVDEEINEFTAVSGLVEQGKTVKEAYREIHDEIHSEEILAIAEALVQFEKREFTLMEPGTTTPEKTPTTPEDWYRKELLPTMWCAGCGAEAVWKSLAVALSESGYTKDEVVVVSGIGCSARINVYLDVNTVHTAHGRALTVAAGIKVANPELKVLVVMGDGDAVGIGGNHFLHAARKGLDITAVIVNNSIYGMTGGQMSPATPYGSATATGMTQKEAFKIAETAVHSGAPYVARVTTQDKKGISEHVKASMKRDGLGVIEVLAQCPTQFGKRNAKIPFSKENTISVVEAAKMSLEQLKNKYVIGLLKDELQEKVEAGQKKNIELKEGIYLLHGNEAIVQGAIKAGVGFYGGYPITPSSEVLQRLSNQEGVDFLQTEDEIAAIGTVLGASWAGKKAMTATSGPGISLMEELIGLGVSAEVPSVLVNVMRGGPSTGLPTRPSQGDVNQAVYGSHGDAPRIVLAPATGQECFDATIAAFNLAEKYSTPVILLSDAQIAHTTTNNVRIYNPKEIINRRKPEVASSEYIPYGQRDEKGVPALADMGEGYRYHRSGLTTNEAGLPFPGSNADAIEKAQRNIIEKIEGNEKDIRWTKRYKTEDAEILIITYGSVALSAMEAVDRARAQGKKVGLLQLIAISPFPEDEVRELAGNVDRVIVPELNNGQVAQMVERVTGIDKVKRIPWLRGDVIPPAEIVKGIFGDEIRAEAESEEGRLNIGFTGVGGEGMILSGNILAQAGAMSGRNVTQTRFYDPAPRGGESSSKVIVSNSDIVCPEPDSLDILVALDDKALMKYLPQLRRGGMLLIDSAEIKKKKEKLGKEWEGVDGLLEKYGVEEDSIEVVEVPFTKITKKELKKTQVTNVLVLGVISQLTGMVSLTDMKEAVNSLVPEKFRELNIKALDIGSEVADGIIRERDRAFYSETRADAISALEDILLVTEDAELVDAFVRRTRTISALHRAGELNAETTLEFLKAIFEKNLGKEKDAYFHLRKDHVIPAIAGIGTREAFDMLADYYLDVRVAKTLREPVILETLSNLGKQLAKTEDDRIQYNTEITILIFRAAFKLASEQLMPTKAGQPIPETMVEMRHALDVFVKAARGVSMTYAWDQIKTAAADTADTLRMRMEFLKGAIELNVLPCGVCVGKGACSVVAAAMKKGEDTASSCSSHGGNVEYTMAQVEAIQEILVRLNRAFLLGTEGNEVSVVFDHIATQLEKMEFSENEISRADRKILAGIDVRLTHLGSGLKNSNFETVDTESGWPLLMRKGESLPSVTGKILFKSIVNNARALENYVERTPLVRFNDISDRTGLNVYVKDEGQQVTGAFKPRILGQFFKNMDNWFKRLWFASRYQVITTGTTGNQGKAVAWAVDVMKTRFWMLFGYMAQVISALRPGLTRRPLTARLFIAGDTPKVKEDKIREYGAEIFRQKGQYDQAETAALLESGNSGVYYMTHSGPLSVSSYGSLGLEMVRDIIDRWKSQGVISEDFNFDKYIELKLKAEKGRISLLNDAELTKMQRMLQPLSKTAVLVPVGAGGVASGVFMALKQLNPEVTVIGVASDRTAAMYESLYSDRVERVKTGRDILEDGINVQSVERFALQIFNDLADGMVIVPSSRIEEGIRAHYREAGIKSEGASVLPYLALEEYPELLENMKSRGIKDVMLLSTGSNIDNEVWQNIVNGDFGKNLEIGVVTEIKSGENRVGLTPRGVAAMVEKGIRVIVQKGAGEGCRYTDEEYIEAGATILDSAEEIWNRAGVVIKVKETLPEERKYLREGLILYNYNHLSGDKQLTLDLLNSGADVIPFETIIVDGVTKQLVPMSLVAGRRSAWYIGEELNGLSKDRRQEIRRHIWAFNEFDEYFEIPEDMRIDKKNVVVLGAGAAGMQAAEISLAMGANVIMTDINAGRRAELKGYFEGKGYNGRINVIDDPRYKLKEVLSREQIRRVLTDKDYVPELEGMTGSEIANVRKVIEAIENSQAVIDTIYIHGARAPTVMDRNLLASITSGKVISDISIDQGGGVEFVNSAGESVEKMTSHDEPTVTDYFGHIHYRIPNIPGSTPRVASKMLEDTTVLLEGKPYLEVIAKQGYIDAVREYPELARGITQGRLTDPVVAKDLSLEFNMLAGKAVALSRNIMTYFQMLIQMFMQTDPQSKLFAALSKATTNPLLLVLKGAEGAEVMADKEIDEKGYRKFVKLLEELSGIKVIVSAQKPNLVFFNKDIYAFATVGKNEKDDLELIVHEAFFEALNNHELPENYDLRSFLELLVEHELGEYDAMENKNKAYNKFIFANNWPATPDTYHAFLEENEPDKVSVLMEFMQAVEEDVEAIVSVPEDVDPDKIKEGILQQLEVVTAQDPQRNIPGTHVFIAIKENIEKTGVLPSPEDVMNIIRDVEKQLKMEFKPVHIISMFQMGLLEQVSLPDIFWDTKENRLAAMQFIMRAVQVQTIKQIKKESVEELLQKTGFGDVLKKHSVEQIIEEVNFFENLEGVIKPGIDMISDEKGGIRPEFKEIYDAIFTANGLTAEDIASVGSCAISFRIIVELAKENLVNAENLIKSGVFFKAWEKDELVGLLGVVAGFLREAVIDEEGNILMDDEWKSIFKQFADEDGNISLMKLLEKELHLAVVIGLLKADDRTFAFRVTHSVNLSALDSDKDNNERFGQVMPMLMQINQKDPAVALYLVDNLNKFLTDDVYYENLMLIFDDTSVPFFRALFNMKGKINEVFRADIADYLEGELLNTEKVFGEPGSAAMFMGRVLVSFHAAGFPLELDKEGFFEKYREEIIESPQAMLKKLYLLGEIAKHSQPLARYMMEHYFDEIENMLQETNMLIPLSIFLHQVAKDLFVIKKKYKKIFKPFLSKENKDQIDIDRIIANEAAINAFITMVNVSQMDIQLAEFFADKDVYSKIIENKEYGEKFRTIFPILADLLEYNGQPAKFTGIMKGFTDKKTGVINIDSILEEPVNMFTFKTLYEIASRNVAAAEYIVRKNILEEAKKDQQAMQLFSGMSLEIAEVLDEMARVKTEYREILDDFVDKPTYELDIDSMLKNPPKAVLFMTLVKLFNINSKEAMRLKKEKTEDLLKDQKALVTLSTLTDFYKLETPSPEILDNMLQKMNVFAAMIMYNFERLSRILPQYCQEIRQDVVMYVSQQGLPAVDTINAFMDVMFEVANKGIFDAAGVVHKDYRSLLSDYIDESTAMIHVGKIINSNMDMLKFETYLKLASVNRTLAIQFAKSGVMDRFITPEMIEVDYIKERYRKSLQDGLMNLAKASPTLFLVVLNRGYMKDIIGDLNRIENLNVISGWLAYLDGFLDKDGKVNPEYQYIFEGYTDPDGFLRLGDLLRSQAKMYSMIGLLRLMEFQSERGPGNFEMAEALVNDDFFKEYILKEENAALGFLIFAGTEKLGMILNKDWTVRKQYRGALEKYIVQDGSGKLDFAEVFIKLNDAWTAQALMDLVSFNPGLAEKVSVDGIMEKLAKSEKTAYKFKETLPNALRFLMTEDYEFRQFSENFGPYVDGKGKLDLFEIMKTRKNQAAFGIYFIWSLINNDFLSYLKSTGWYDKILTDESLAKSFDNLWGLKNRVDANGVVDAEWHGILKDYIDADGKLNVYKLTNSWKDIYYLQGLFMLAEADMELAKQVDEEGMLKNICTGMVLDDKKKQDSQYTAEIFKDKGNNFVMFTFVIKRIYEKNPAIAEMILSNRMLIENLLSNKEMLFGLFMQHKTFDKLLDEKGLIKEEFREIMAGFCSEQGNLFIAQSQPSALVFESLATAAITNKAFAKKLASNSYIPTISNDPQLSVRLQKGLQLMLETSDKKGNVDEKYAGLLKDFMRNRIHDVKKIINTGVKLKAFTVLVKMAREDVKSAEKFAVTRLFKDIMSGKDNRLTRMAAIAGKAVSVMASWDEVGSGSMKYFSTPKGTIDWDKILDSGESAALFSAMADISKKERKMKVEVLEQLYSVINWDELLKNRDSVIGFSRFVGENVIRWVSENPDMMAGLPVINEKIYEFMMVIETFDNIRYNADLVSKLFDRLEKIKRSSAERDSFQLAFTFLNMAADLKTIGREEATGMLSELLEMDTAEEYQTFIKEGLSAAARKNFREKHSEYPEIDTDWRKALVIGLTGWDIPENRRFRLNLDGIVNKVESVVDQMGADRNDDRDYFLALIYALHLRFYSPEIIARFEKGYHKKHGFDCMSWNNGFFWRTFIGGNLLALASEIGHAVGGKLDIDLKWVSNAELQDRLGGVNILRKTAHLAFENASEYVIQVNKYAEGVLEEWITGRIEEEDKEKLLEKLKKQISKERLLKIRKAVEDDADTTVETVLEMLTPSEIYNIGKEMAGEELFIDDAVMDFRREFIEAAKEKAKEDIDNAVGVMAFSTEKYHGVRDVVLKPYEAYREIHEMAERLSQDVFVKLVLALRDANVDVNVIPYVNAKATEWILTTTKQKTTEDWESVVEQAKKIDAKLINKWVAELAEENIVNIDKSIPVRTVSFETVIREAREMGVKSISNLLDTFSGFIKGDLVLGLHEVITERLPHIASILGIFKGVAEYVHEEEQKQIGSDVAYGEDLAGLYLNAIRLISRIEPNSGLILALLSAVKNSAVELLKGPGETRVYDIEELEDAAWRSQLRSLQKVSGFKVKISRQYSDYLLADRNMYLLATVDGSEMIIHESVLKTLERRGAPEGYTVQSFLRLLARHEMSESSFLNENRGSTSADFHELLAEVDPEQMVLFSFKDEIFDEMESPTEEYLWHEIEPAAEEVLDAEVDEAFEAGVHEIGRDIFDRTMQHQKGVSGKLNIAGKIMEWGMKDEYTKLQLLFFIDVLPKLTSRGIVQHMAEYFPVKDTRLPVSLRLMVGIGRIAAKVPFVGTPIVAAIVRFSVKMTAKNFFAGVTEKEVGKAITKSASKGLKHTIDVLGEAVLSKEEADEYVDTYINKLLSSEGLRGKLENVSVKLTSLYSEFNPMDFEGTKAAVKTRLKEIVEKAKEAGVFVNIDIEQYDYKDITIEIFKEMILEDEGLNMNNFGIAIQAYLEDSYEDVSDLVDFAKINNRTFTLRLVKGAYWEYENLISEYYGWESPVFGKKHETDLNYELIINLLFENKHLIKPAIATHNIRSMAVALAIADKYGATPEEFEFQILYGMGEAMKKALIDKGYTVREYTPYGKLLVGMAYLVRRILENTSNDSFLRLTFHEGQDVDSLLAAPAYQAKLIKLKGHLDRINNVLQAKKAEKAEKAAKEEKEISPLKAQYEKYVGILEERADGAVKSYSAEINSYEYIPYGKGKVIFSIRPDAIELRKAVLSALAAGNEINEILVPGIAVEGAEYLVSDLVKEGLLEEAVRVNIYSDKLALDAVSDSGLDWVFFKGKKEEEARLRAQAAVTPEDAVSAKIMITGVRPELVMEFVTAKTITENMLRRGVAPELSGSAKYRTPFRNESLVDFSEESERRQMVRALEKVKNTIKTQKQPSPLIIGGKEVKTDGIMESVNPADPSLVVGSVYRARPAEAEEAVKAAKKAFESWSRKSASERAEFLHAALRIMRKRKYELAAWMTYEVGKNWRQALGDVDEAMDFLDFYAHEAVRIEEEDKTKGITDWQRVPRGVCAVVAPWNFPLAILTGMTAGAVASGNTAIMKPASQSFVIAGKLMDIFREAGLPEGVVNYLPGMGREIGDYLVSHPDVDMITFTGSEAVGLSINEKAGKTDREIPKKVIAEMGGKDAVIVDSSADIDQAVAGVVTSAFGFSGQKCSACSRVIVHEDVYEEFLERLKGKVAALKIGDGIEPDTFVNPVIDAGAREKTLGFIERAKNAGIDVLVERGIAPLVEKGEINKEGFYVGPVVFKDVPRDAEIAQEEIFAPVLAVMKARSFDDAVDIANDTRFALTGGIYSRTPSHIERAKKEFMVGNFYINRNITGALVSQQPFGGFKRSGIGLAKAGGPDYMYQFMRWERTVAEEKDKIDYAQIKVDGFDKLSKNQKLLAYYLHQSALAGWDITFKQFHKQGLTVRNLMEEIITHSDGIDPVVLEKIRDYTHRVWAMRGIYHNVTQKKQIPDFTLEELQAAALKAKENGAFQGADNIRNIFGLLIDEEPARYKNAVLVSGGTDEYAVELLAPALKNMIDDLDRIIFDPDFDPVLTNMTESADKALSSGVNFYENLTDAEIDSYKKPKTLAGRIGAWMNWIFLFGWRTRQRPYERYSENSRLVKVNGRLTEQVARAGDPKKGIPAGILAEEYANMIRNLGKAIEYAEPKQAKALRHLVNHFRTGDPKEFERYNIAWVQDGAFVDVVIGLIESYDDPYNKKATFEASLNIGDPTMDDIVSQLRTNAEYMEKNAPWDDLYKKKEVQLPNVKFIQDILRTGSSGGISHTLGYNLPNDRSIVEKYGTKSTIIQNIMPALEEAKKGKVLAEYSADPERDSALKKKWGKLSTALMIAFHEGAGHALGRNNPSLSGISKDHLKQYYLALEEARAELAALWFIGDEEFLANGLVPDEKLTEWAFRSFMMSNGLVSLRTVPKSSDRKEGAHAIGRNLIVNYLLGFSEDSLNDLKKAGVKNLRRVQGALELKVIDGKTYVEVIDVEKAHEAVGELAAELMRVIGEGDFKAAKALVETYGVPVNTELRDEVHERYETLDIPLYIAEIQPELRPVYDASGMIIDVEIFYPENFEEQMLRNSGRLPQMAVNSEGITVPIDSIGRAIKAAGTMVPAGDLAELRNIMSSIRELIESGNAAKLDEMLPVSKDILERVYQYQSRDKESLVVDTKNSIGSYLATVDGEYLLDMASGFGSNPMGYNRPEILNAFLRYLSDAANNLAFSDFITESYVRYTEKLSGYAKCLGLTNVFFCNTGAESVENAIKAAKYHRPASEYVVSFEHAFHGRSLGAISATDKIKIKEKFVGMFHDWPKIVFPGITQKDTLNGRLAFQSVKNTIAGEEQLRKAVLQKGGLLELERVLEDAISVSDESVLTGLGFTSDAKREEAGLLLKEVKTLLSFEKLVAAAPEKCAAIIAEPIQGEGGDMHATYRFWRAFRLLTRRTDISVPMIMDEVQTGFGTTGTFFAFEKMGLVTADGRQDHPDMVTTAKKAQLG
ncbi:MAG: 2-oxoacid:acceptor oxidoreductase subunit alpha, partial [Elusimicrobiota bacterium]